MPSYKILHVEDDKDWADLLARWLSSRPFRLYRAPSGEEAVSLAEKVAPDLAILDIRLSDMSGHDLCRRLRELPGLERLPIIALSIYDPERLKSLRVGADAFVSKAAAESELLPTMEALLRRVQMDLGVVEKGDLRIVPQENAVFLGGKPVGTLSRMEFLLLHALVKNSPEPLSARVIREEILRSKARAKDSRSLEMLVARTRRRLGRALAGRVKGSRKFGWATRPKPKK